MSNRNYDMIIFGATGTIGRRITHYIYQHSPLNRWAIMGRSHTELSSLMGELRQLEILGILPDILIADAQDFRTLRDTFVETRLLLNCVRPYRTLGKDIIEACLMARCDYMDLCSETYFIESNFLEFHEEAKKKNVFILHACGFDSAVSNLGVLFTLRNFQPDECNSIESFLSVTAPEGLGGDFKVYETLLNNQKDKSSLSSLRSKIEERFSTPSVAYPGPRIAKKSDSAFDKRVGKFIVPNFGPDHAIMDQSMKTLALMTDCTSWPQYYSYIAMNNYYLASSTSFYSSLCSTLATFSAGRTLLRSFPSVFTDGVISKKGPSEEQLSSTTFQFQFIARGFAVMEEESAAAVTEEQKLLRKTAALAGGANVVTEQPDWVSNPSGGGNTRTIIPRNDLNETIVVENGPVMCGLWGGANEGKNTYNNDLTGKVPIEMRVCVSGAEPYCLTTTMVCVALARCLLEEREAQRVAAYSEAATTTGANGVTVTAVEDRQTQEQPDGPTQAMPLGGVYTPASAFYHSKCVFDRLKAVGIEYRVMTNEELAEESARNLLVEANLAPQPPVTEGAAGAGGAAAPSESARHKATVAAVVPVEDHHHIENEAQRRDRDAVMDLVRNSSILAGEEIPEPVVSAQNYHAAPTRRGITPPPAAEARMA